MNDVILILKTFPLTWITPDWIGPKSMHTYITWVFWDLNRSKKD